MSEDYAGFEAIQKDLLELQGLVHSLIQKMDHQKDHMGTVAAHLENISREAAKTAEVLGQEFEDRKAREEHERALELKNLDRKAAVEDVKRQRIFKAISEVWSLFKAPLAYLLPGLIAYILVTYLEAPDTTAKVPRSKIESREIGEAQDVTD